MVVTSVTGALEVAVNCVADVAMMGDVVVETVPWVLTGDTVWNSVVCGGSVGGWSVVNVVCREREDSNNDVVEDLLGSVVGSGVVRIVEGNVEGDKDGSGPKEVKLVSVGSMVEMEGRGSNHVSSAKSI